MGRPALGLVVEVVVAGAAATELPRVSGKRRFSKFGAPLFQQNSSMEISSKPSTRLHWLCFETSASMS